MTSDSQLRRKLHVHIERNRDRHVARIQEFLRQPSISGEDIGVVDCARLLAEYLRELSFTDVKLVETSGYPVVYGEYDAGAKKSLVIYLMYDVQPVAGEEWSVPPFDAQLVDVPPFGQCIVARGAKNSKGPLRTFLNALSSLQSTLGTLPVNLLVVAEGEEELGSRHLPQFIAQYGERLARADAALFPYCLQEADGRAVIWPGTKGMVYFQLECSGARWGRGPTQYDVHGGYKVVVDSPAWRLVQALSTLISLDGNSPAIDDFDTPIRQPSPSEEESLEELRKTFSWRPMCDLLKIDRLVDDPDPLRRLFFSPAVNLDGLWTGYTGEGAKTTLPHVARAKVHMRLVPDQSTEQAEKALRSHLNRRGYKDIAIRRLGGGEWSQTSPDSTIVAAVKRGCQIHGVEPEVWPRNPGFAPGYLFNHPPVSLPFCIGGLGHGGRSHSPDEYFVLDGKGIVADITTVEECFATTLLEYAGLTQ